MEISGGHKRAVVVGASGLVGGFVLRYLLLHPAYKEIVVLVRKPLDIRDSKLKQVIVDFNQIQKSIAEIKGEDLFIALGTTMAKAGSKKAFYEVDFTYIVDVAKMAVENKMNQIMLVSSTGANAESMFYYSRVKGEMEQAVRKLPFWSTHIFQPSVLLGSRNENRFGENLAGFIGLGLNKITGGLLSKYRPIEAEVVAKSMVAAAQQFNQGIHVYPNSVLQKLSLDWDRPFAQITAKKP